MGSFKRLGFLLNKFVVVISEALFNKQILVVGSKYRIVQMSELLIEFVVLGYVGRVFELFSYIHHGNVGLGDSVGAGFQRFYHVVLIGDLLFIFDLMLEARPEIHSYRSYLDFYF